MKKKGERAKSEKENSRTEKPDVIEVKKRVTNRGARGNTEGERKHGQARRAENAFVKKKKRLYGTKRRGIREFQERDNVGGAYSCKKGCGGSEKNRVFSIKLLDK